MSEIAEELGRRVTPDALKARAKELARDQATHIKDSAKERVMSKTYELRDQYAGNPRSRGMLGALVGAGVGAFLARRFLGQGGRDYRYERREFSGRDYGRDYRRDYWAERDLPRERSYAAGATGAYAEGDYSDAALYGASGAVDYRSDEAYRGRDEGDGHAGLKEKAQGAVDTVREKAQGAVDSVREKAHGAVDTVRERTSHAAGNVREHLPSRAEARDWYGRMLDEQPLALALGAIALGMIGSALVPVTDRERRLVEPAKRRATDALQQVGERVEQKLGGGEQRESQRADVDYGTRTAGGMSMGAEREGGSAGLGGGASGLSGAGGYGASSSSGLGGASNYGSGASTGIASGGSLSSSAGVSGTGASQGYSPAHGTPDSRLPDTGSSSSDSAGTARSSSDDNLPSVH